ncbi:unnamed protein product [Heligmosomoides polygyrus]|uniref:Uncharacterized protein n=1 Tax=Heligmosomoides polygyrus TaxID=6339 RepID=A0A183FYQ2_HELPZ|nr:unnamed protein product [Heligmosomoides polygyrus]
MSSSGTSCRRRAYHITSRGTRSKAFSNSRKAICTGFCFSRCVSIRRRAACMASMCGKFQAALCDHYREKCETKMKKANCKQRASECLEYADNGLRVTWSFCKSTILHSNNNTLSTRQQKA